jgi:prophage antirepressor-like protein
MTAVRYVCASSSRSIDGKLNEHAAWFDFHQVAHLFGIRPERAAKVLWQVGASGEINEETDLKRNERRGCLLSHRAVVAVGYHMNYGRANAFQKWCASELAALLH